MKLEINITEKVEKFKEKIEINIPEKVTCFKRFDDHYCLLPYRPFDDEEIYGIDVIVVHGIQSQISFFHINLEDIESEYNSKDYSHTSKYTAVVYDFLFNEDDDILKESFLSFYDYYKDFNEFIKNKINTKHTKRMIKIDNLKS